MGAITIPPNVIPTVRRGAYGVIRLAAEAIVELHDTEGDKRTSGAGHRRELLRLQRAHALLDAIRWQEPRGGFDPEPMQIDAEYNVSLYDALGEGIVGAEHVAEAKREGTQHAEQTVEAAREFLDTLSGGTA
jgi:hypothetical protein